MAVTVLCVGKMKEAFYADAAREYLRRLGRLMPVSVTELPDEREPENAGAALVQQTLQREGQRILAKISPQEHVIAMCIDAKQPTSEELAAKLETLFVEGKSHVTFVIGGSLGLSAEVLSRANERMSMSRMTFPHQLARVVLLEQLFRAAKINAGERYHK